MCANEFFFFFFTMVCGCVCTMVINSSRLVAVVIAIIFLVGAHFIDNAIVSKNIFPSGQGTHTHCMILGAMQDS